MSQLDKWIKESQTNIKNIRAGSLFFSWVLTGRVGRVWPLNKMEFDADSLLSQPRTVDEIYYPILSNSQLLTLASMFCSTTIR